MTIDFTSHPYQLSKADKAQFLMAHLQSLTQHHQAHCSLYQRMIETLYPDRSSPLALDELPFLPVQLFKQLVLKSIADQEVFKRLTSSGTTSQTVSQIYLDRETASLQTKALVAIVSHFIGRARLPMLVIDHPGVIKNRAAFSARGAGILGFSSFGQDHTYALTDEMAIDMDSVQQFLAKHQGKKLLLFGFTFMVWQYFYDACVKANVKFDFSQAILIHGGGWKKLADLQIQPETFQAALKAQFNLAAIHDYYGMVEQVGTIFMACVKGHLHAPVFADVIIRDPMTLKPLGQNQLGLIQVLSVLPKSYPGHSILTEDLGICLGEDDCACGLKSKYFAVQGRLPKAELRGCSDTFQKKENGGQTL